MIISLSEIEKLATSALVHGQVDEGVKQFAVAACRFLEAVGYPGLKLLAEAIDDETRSRDIVFDELGADLALVSCVFLGPALKIAVAARGRIFLRNVRHGLYLLPMTLDMNIGIGCPVDPGFALGGERTKNPYLEKLALAEAQGVLVDDAVLRNLETR